MYLVFAHLIFIFSYYSNHKNKTQSIVMSCVFRISCAYIAWCNFYENCTDFWFTRLLDYKIYKITVKSIYKIKQTKIELIHTIWYTSSVTIEILLIHILACSVCPPCSPRDAFITFFFSSELIGWWTDSVVQKQCLTKPEMVACFHHW